MDLANKLQKLRNENGMTQTELAEKLMVSRQAVSKWENGVAVPDIENIIAISELFSVTVDYLIKNDEQEGIDVQKDSNESCEERSVKKSRILVAGAVIVLIEASCIYMNVPMVGVTFIMWGIILLGIYVIYKILKIIKK